MSAGVVIVDTSVWIDYLGGAWTPQVDWLGRELEHRRLGLTDLILSEVLQGIRDDEVFADVEAKLLNFEIFATGGTELALAAAGNCRRLHARGRTVQTTAVGLIATFCLLGGHDLLHDDREFDGFEQVLGLQVIHP
jgi:predicted nucleic acid-binding protein